MSYQSDPVAHSGQRNTRRPRVMIAGFFLHLVHWKVNTALDLLTYLVFSIPIGFGSGNLKPDCVAVAITSWFFHSHPRGAVGCVDPGGIIGEFEARIQHQGDTTEGLVIHVQIADHRLRVWAGSNRLGSWPLEEIEVERVTPFRFRIVVEGDEMMIIPNDPTGFAEATNAFVDARTHRFGLAARLRAVGEA